MVGGRWSGWVGAAAAGGGCLTNGEAWSVSSPVAWRGEYHRLWRGLGSVVGGAFFGVFRGFHI